VKLSTLYEYLVPYAAGLRFYGDPKWKDNETEDKSHLVGGKKDRKRFLKSTSKKKKKKNK